MILHDITFNLSDIGWVLVYLAMPRIGPQRIYKMKNILY